MLTIPAAVQALFRTDGVRKNFRAHFPGGELPDITNDDVVRESVRFTESLCSRNVLRFGLTEASMIEFETVNIGNIAGMVIECGIEIDTSSLTAAQITAIQASPGDGTLVLVSDSDTGYGYYRIPYGTFCVNRCQRNQQAMTHRRVVAYSTALVGSDLPWLEQQKLQAYGPDKDFSTNLRKLAFSLMASAGGTGILSGNSFTRSLLADTTTIPVTLAAASTTFNVVVNGGTYALTARTYRHRCSLATSMTDYSSPPREEIFEVVPGGFLSVLPQVVAWLEAQGVDYAASGFSSMEAIARRIPWVLPGLAWQSITPLGLTRRTYMEETALVVPYRGPGIYVEFDAPSSIELEITDLSLSTTVTPSDPTPAALYIWSDGAPEAQTISFAATNKGNSGQGKWYQFIDAYAFDDLVNGFLELHGLFARISRAGGFALAALDDSAPIAIGPPDTDEAWWDDYDVQPVGSVLYVYGDGNTAQYDFDDGGSVYDVTDNWILLNMPNATRITIEALLDAALIPALDAVHFTPVEMTIRGLPWIEAGDALQITAEDGTVIDTYALRQEISGIQALFTDVESQGGEMMESWEV